AEAKKYRLRARDAENRAATLQTRVDAHDKATVERIAGDLLEDPSDLWLAHSGLDAFRGEDGAIDSDAATAAIQELVNARPHWAKQPTARINGGVRRPARLPKDFGSELKRAVGG